jgi:hypothetical protein
MYPPTELFRRTAQCYLDPLHMQCARQQRLSWRLRKTLVLKVTGDVSRNKTNDSCDNIETTDRCWRGMCVWWWGGLRAFQNITHRQKLLFYRIQGNEFKNGDLQTCFYQTLRTDFATYTEIKSLDVLEKISFVIIHFAQYFWGDFYQVQ